MTQNADATNKKNSLFMLKRDFIRVSKQGLLNLKQVKSLRADINRKIGVTLRNGEQIIVSRMYADELRKRLGVK